MGEKYIIAENMYGKYYVPRSTIHRCGSSELIEGAVHEPETIKLILKNRGDGVVIHAGAFIGDFLPALSEKGKPVLAFEPGIEFFMCCQKTMELNFPDGNHDTTLINKGLSSEPSIGNKLLTMEDEFKGEGGCARIITHPDGVEAHRMETVELTTIDISLSRWDNVSIIHLDIEGFEENALRGAINTLRTSKPLLILEIESRNKMDSDFYTNVIFGELGYEDIGQVHGWNRILKVK